MSHLIGFRLFPRVAALLSLVVLGILPAESGAQSLAFGTLSGVVRDAIGQPLADAEVRIVERVSGASRSRTTARDGVFRFDLLSPSSYDVTVEVLGFRPVLHTDVGVRSGASTTIRVALNRQAPPVNTIDTVRAVGTRTAPLGWLQDRGYPELAGGRRLATDVSALSPSADESSVEGLPWRFAGLMIDGAHLGAVGAPNASGNATYALAIPARAVSAATVGGLGFDVETGGSGVGMSVLSRRGGGTPGFRGAVFGGTSDVGGAADFSGPIQTDTAHAVGGVDYQRSEVIRPAYVLDGDAPGLALVTIARDSFGTDLARYRAETPRLEERLSGYGRLDWQLGDRYALTLRGAGTRLVSSDPPLLAGDVSGFGSRHEANSVQAAVNVVARISERLTSELRVSGDFGETRGAQPALPMTTFAGRGLTLGGGSDEPFTDSRTSPRVNALVHIDLGAHRVKLGAAIASHRVESIGANGSSGEFRFGDAADFSAATGAWRGVSGFAGSGNFRLTEQSWFVQDAWRVADGFGLTYGLRFDANRASLGDIEQNANWLARSGVDNATASADGVRVAPRIGFRWELGPDRGWILDGGAGIYNDLPDRRDVAEALTLDRGLEVRYASGPLGGWPAAPDSVVAPVVGRTLSVLGPEFEGPRTRRIAVGLQRDLAAWTAYVRGVYRQTDFLTRRRDLNLPLTQVGSDQYGRPLYGMLRQTGSLLSVVPGSNRRFGEFDAVNAIEVTGFSEYWGATTGIERVQPQGLSFGLHYTFSRTSDNLASGIAALAPLASGLNGGEWADGTADTDIPHRVIAAGEWSATSAGTVRFGVVYRLQSGHPFTPGFRDGVDANGDGVWGNDPAFVDGSRPGMDALLAQWSCLRSGAGAIAERNACRGDWAHRLDLRAAIRLGGLAGGPLELVVDAMNVIPSSTGPRDRALYLVDRTASLTTNTSTGVSTVPLVVNPAFGTILADRSAGMLFRVGLRVGR